MFAPLLFAQEGAEICVAGQWDPIIPQKRESDFLWALAEGHRENLAPASFCRRTGLQGIRGNFLSIKFSIEDGKQRRILPVFFHRHGHAIKAALVIKSSFLDKLRIIGVGLRFRSPNVELGEERRPLEFIEIREKNGARIRGHQGKRVLARGTVRYAPLAVSEKGAGP